MTKRGKQASEGSTALQPLITRQYFESREMAARYAIEMQKNLIDVCPLTMTIAQDGSGDFCVHTATGMSSDDTETLISFLKQVTT